MKNTVGKNIKRIRKAKKLTQKRLSELTGFSQNGISNHENGNRNIDELDIMIYAEALGVKPQDLFDKQTESPVEVIPATRVPVVSEISAGMPIYSEQNIVDYSYIPSFLDTEGKDVFYLRVDGDSMDREFSNGDLVLVEKDAPIENGQIGVVMVNGYNATVKRVKYNDNQVILMPSSTNDDHLPQFYNADDDLTFIGRVISSQRFY